MGNRQVLSEPIGERKACEEQYPSLSPYVRRVCNEICENLAKMG